MKCHINIDQYLYYCINFIPPPTPPPNKIWGNIGISIHLSVCAIVSGPFYLLWRNIGYSYYTQRLNMTWGCVMILTQGIWASSRSLEQKMHNWCPIYIFFIENYWKFHFSQRSAVQGHCKKKLHSSCLCHILLWKMIKAKNWYKDCVCPKLCPRIEFWSLEEKRCTHFFPIENTWVIIFSQWGYQLWAWSQYLSLQ